MSRFPPVAPRLAPATVGAARVEHFTIADAAEAAYAGLRTRTYDMQPGTYATLHIDGRLWMSDTPYEARSNREFLSHARRGAVLVAGLGLGFILPPVLARPEVTSVTVVERSADVVALVGPSLADPKLRLVTADIDTWRPPRGTRYDTIYFDIWPNACEDNLPHVARLHQAFKGYLNRANPAAWMGSWQAVTLRAQRRRNPYARSRRW
jgi:hypothetical protein